MPSLHFLSRYFRWPLIVGCLLMGLLVTAVQAELDEELTKANAAYTETIKKQKEVLKAAFERKLMDASRSGDLQRFEDLKAEQARFENAGENPTSAAMKNYGQKYSKAVETAEERLRVAYDKKVKALTRDRQIDEAKDTLNALNEFLSSRKKQDAAAEEMPLDKVEPAVEPVDPGSDDTQAFNLVKAVWRHDGHIGNPGPQVFDATKLIQATLFRQGEFVIDGQTLGGLDGSPASKSLFLHLSIFRLPVHLQLSEGSSMELGQTTGPDLRKPGIRMGTTPLELFEVIWESPDVNKRVDVTQDAQEALLAGPLTIAAPIFPEISSGHSKRARFRFRAGQQTIEFVAGERSVVVFPMNDQITYEVPWIPKADGPQLRVVWRKAIWRDSNGDKLEDVTAKASALLETRKTFVCDSETFGLINNPKAPKNLSVDLLVNDLPLELSLVEGSQFTLSDVTAKDLTIKETSISNSPVTIVDFWHSAIDGSSGGSSTMMIDALFPGTRVEPPLFPERNAPGKVKVAKLRLRVGQRILTIGARDDSFMRIHVTR